MLVEAAAALNRRRLAVIRRPKGRSVEGLSFPEEHTQKQIALSRDGPEH